MIGPQRAGAGVNLTPALTPQPDGARTVEARSTLTMCGRRRQQLQQISHNY